MSVEVSVGECDKVEMTEEATATCKNGSAAAGTERIPGLAKVKDEYVIRDYKPRLEEAYVSDSVKRELESDKTDDGEPPSKKVKLKGQNKRKMKDRWREESGDKLCVAILLGKPCNFGEKCKFKHDIQEYIDQKMPDLEGECPSYRELGHCTYGVTCRFSKDHVENLKNLVNQELVEKNSKNPQTLNILNKKVMNLLRKHAISFVKSDAFFKQNGIKPNHRMSGTPCDRSLNMNLKENLVAVGGENSDSVHAKTNVTETDVKEPSTSASRSPDTGSDNIEIRLRPEEKKTIDFRDKLYLAPLTTVGNLPFRRICKKFGADITCGEMAMATNILQGKHSEWALLKRHESEDVFGVQLCGGYADSMVRCAELINSTCDVDFVDINVGCPIDLIYQKGAGSALMGRSNRLGALVRGMSSVLDVPLTVKMRTGLLEEKSNAHELIPKCRDWGASMVTLHGRSREQRYTKRADWDYISKCAAAADPMPLFGNGDILSYEDYEAFRASSGVAGTMIARGAIIKPWIFTEIKERRHWDIRSSERLDMLRDFTRSGLMHWGSDPQGVETTRRFLLEWQSFLYRYVPVGLLEHVPQRINERPEAYRGRDDLETLMASANCADWIKISEMLLGPVPPGFTFLPKHKANAYK